MDKSKTLEKKIGAYQTSLGKQYAIIGAMLATVIALALLSAGVYLIVRPDPYTAVTEANILLVTCFQASEIVKDFTCDIRYAYVVDGTTYIADLRVTFAKTYQVGDTFKIQYDPNDPTRSRLYQTPPIIIGSGLVIVGVVLAVIAWGIVWFSRRRKFVSKS